MHAGYKPTSNFGEVRLWNLTIGRICHNDMVVASLEIGKHLWNLFYEVTASCDRGNEQTFITTNRQEVLIQNIREWKVLNENIFSDHRHIAYNFVEQANLKKV